MVLLKIMLILGVKRVVSKVILCAECVKNMGLFGK